MERKIVALSKEWGCIYLGLRKAYRIKITFGRKMPYGPVSLYGLVLSEPD